MKEITSKKRDIILHKFINIDEVFENEKDTNSLVYSSFVVSFWNNWLKREDFEAEIEETDKSAEIINQNRKEVLSSLYPDVLYYSSDDFSEYLYEFFNIEEYLSFLEKTLRNEYMETLICPQKAIIIELGGEFSDIYHFLKTDSTAMNIEKIKAKSKQHNLNFFSY